MKKVTKYEADDGTLFGAADEAELHDLKLEVQDLVSRSGCYYCGEFSFSKALDVVLANYVLVRRTAFEVAAKKQG